MAHSSCIPSSICTLSTNSCIFDLNLFLHSLSISNPSIPIIILTDTPTQSFIHSILPSLNNPITILNSLDIYSNKNRHQMEIEKIWTNFQLEKTNSINYALSLFPNTLFLDCDIFVINPLLLPDNYLDFDIGLSPHYIKKSDTDKYGFFNGGVVWTQNKNFSNKWIEFTLTSRFFEQASLEDCSKYFKTFLFDENYNLSWWRLNQSDKPLSTMLNFLSYDNSNIYYKNKPIIFIHTHFNHSNLNFFNTPIKKLLQKSTDKLPFFFLLS